MEATSGFFQKCQQYLNFRGSNSSAGSKISQNYQVGSEDSDIEDNENFDEDSNDQSLSSRFTPFQRSYQKVSTEDKTTKYDKCLFFQTYDLILLRLFSCHVVYTQNTILKCRFETFVVHRNG